MPLYPVLGRLEGFMRNALEKYNIVLLDEIATQTLAEKFAAALKAHIAAHGIGLGIQCHLSGDLGAGKTTWVRALLRACGYTERVKSPTYTLCEPYALTFQTPSANTTVEHTHIDVYHFDLYRLRDAREWEEAGFRDYLSGALCLIEWPERAPFLIPDVAITLCEKESGRHAHIEAHSQVGKILVDHVSYAR